MRMISARAVICSVIAFNCTAFGQTHSDTEMAQRLHKSQQELLTVWSDLLDYRKAGGPFSPELSIVDDMIHSADSVSTYVSSTATLMNVLGLVSGPEEKRTARQYVNLLLQTYIKKIDVHLETVNNLLVRSKSQAIVLAGNQLKNEMRKSKELLDAIQAAQ